jgi:hypothetical protein
MDQANLELANLKGAIFKDAVVREAYVSGATRLTGKVLGYVIELLVGDYEKCTVMFDRR